MASWETSDGKQFISSGSDADNRYQETQARNHQEYLDNMARAGSSGSTQAERESAFWNGYDRAVNKAKNESEQDKLILSYYNESKWDLIIKIIDDIQEQTNTYYYGGFRDYIYCIAKAYRDNDYNDAFWKGDWGEPYDGKNKDVIKFNLHQAVFDAGKKIWERKNGRAMTNDDLKQVHIKFYEERIVSNLNELKRKGSRDYDSLNSCIKYWKKLSCRELTKEEQIRIYGKSFLGLFGKIKI